MEQTPDVIKKQEMFKQASEALDNEKWGQLLEIAEELDIHPQKYEKVNELLREEISDVNKKIAHMQKTYGWSMSQAETDDQKDKVIISFLKTLFNYTFNP
jgi:DNA-directed RNA polymerase sigma subunit (sigma70/sigma32)